MQNHSLSPNFVLASEINHRFFGVLFTENRRGAGRDCKMYVVRLYNSCNQADLEPSATKSCDLSRGRMTPFVSFLGHLFLMLTRYRFKVIKYGSSLMLTPGSRAPEGVFILQNYSMMSSRSAYLNCDVKTTELLAIISTVMVTFGGKSY